MRDSNGHKIIYSEETISEKDMSVSVGDHVWIASCSDILSGSKISKNSVVGYRSCVTNKYTKESCLTGGYPAKVLRENIRWER